MTRSRLRSLSANAARGSSFLAASSARTGTTARPIPAATTRTLIVCMREVSSALDLPRAVGLTARGSVRLMLLSADHDRLVVLPAVLAGGELVGARRRDRAGVAGVGVLPRGGLTGPVLLEGALRRLGRHPLVPRVEPVADERAEQGAADSGSDDRAGPASGCRRDPGARCNPRSEEHTS